MTLQPVDPDRDLALLDRWLELPHVRRWWGDPRANRAEVRTPPAGGDHAVITVAGRPVGYVRWQRLPGPALADVGIDHVPDGMVDIDIFIGDEAFLGAGVGTEALRLLLTRLREDSGVSIAGMCTPIGNAAAIRAYEKAGFAHKRQYDDPEWGSCWIMTAPLD